MKKIFPYFIFFIISFSFYYQSFVFNKLPVAADILLGAYYPWLDYDWGYPVSMPVKNPLISDVYSGVYPEKSLIAESYRNFQIPLWNPYSFSGQPLLANFHSGALNPFNLLMVIFGDHLGWTLMMFFQMYLSMTAMYLFIRCSSKNVLPNIAASIIYGLSYFAISWSQFACLGYNFIWLPLILKSLKKSQYLFLPFGIFLLTVSGNFQSLFYSLTIIFFYFIFLNFRKLNPKIFLKFVIYFSLGLLLSSIQLLPTLELISHSVRESENYISSYNYGLLPLNQILTLFVPDFFGNPATYNYWGFFNYFETIVYQGIIPLISILFFIFNFKKLSVEGKFFAGIIFISLLFIFDNPVSRIIYILKVPFLSTSAAGRLFFPLIIGSTYLSREFILAVLSPKKISKISLLSVIIPFFIYIVLMLLTYINYQILHQNAPSDPYVKIFLSSFRNSLLYFFFFLAYVILLLVARFKKILLIFIIILLSFESTRFGWKYLPFVESKFVFASTPIIEFLKNDPEIHFRVIAQKGPVLPANSWTLYRLFSPIGYEPLNTIDYYDFFNQKINLAPSGSGVSRYLEPENYPAKSLGKFNVKYLIALKYDDLQNISPTGKNYHPKINLLDWQPVFSDGSLTIFQNIYYQPYLLTDGVIATLSDFQPNRITINNQVPESANNFITINQNWYPGWIAYDQNFQKLNIIADTNKLTVSVTKPGQVIFEYKPPSFTYGAYLSLFSFIIIFIYHHFNEKK